MEEIQKRTFLDIDYIRSIINRSNSLYSKFHILKRDGTKRWIHHPKKELKLIQRVVNDNVLDKLKIHPSSTAYNRGCSVKKNALLHVNNDFLLRMDFKSFFDSISYDDIENFLDREFSILDPNWTHSDTKLLAKLLCYKNSLVMGAVTSPCISNAICYKLDKKLSGLCQNNNVVYSRYADDLYFSTSERNILFFIEKEVLKIVANLELPSGLTVNNNKTFHSSRKRKKQVTGLILTHDKKLSIGRNKKRTVKSKVHNWKTLNEAERSYLSGYISYIHSIEPQFINRLCLKYGADLVGEIISYNSKL
ncbi:retron St85 family RNA-directed DNA polymerase [Shewanella spartinae]|uniref:retron St85 family RNA-directed DNA polymerase n=1 Tax=Shewanella spartinae TaxID=2864205 RepID=UPI0021AC3AD0|nr:retron St85 family RNA-directed DNA polymerase [Shewanella spartinae]